MPRVSAPATPPGNYPDHILHAWPCWCADRWVGRLMCVPEHIFACDYVFVNSELKLETCSRYRWQCEGLCMVLGFGISRGVLLRRGIAMVGGC